MNALRKIEKEDQEEDASKLVQDYTILFPDRTSRHCQKNETEKTKKEKIALPLTICFLQSFLLTFSAFLTCDNLQRLMQGVKTLTLGCGAGKQ